VEEIEKHSIVVWNSDFPYDMQPDDWKVSKTHVFSFNHLEYRGWLTPLWSVWNLLAGLVPSNRCSIQVGSSSKMPGNGLMNDAWLGQTVKPTKAG